MRPRISLAVTGIVLAASLALAEGTQDNKDEEEKEKPFPAYEGEVTGRRVNIRSGPGTNYTRLLKANTGYRVLVIGQEDDWLRIRMPGECLLWIWKDYIELDAETDIGEVTADNVNVRVAPKLGADVVGQVDEGTCVIVTGGEGDWYEIEPPLTTSAWVYCKYVRRIEPEDD